MHKFDSSIFREYDIRGVYGETLHDDDAYFIARAYSTLLPAGSTICIAYDGRLSSPTVSKRLIDGLLDSGINVVNLGLGPTPLAYFGCFHLDLDGAIMVTASHNPSEYNGFKMMLGKDSLFGDGIAQLPKITEFRDGEGELTEQNIKPAYIQNLLDQLVANNLRIAWDPSNGAMGEIVDDFTAKIGGEQFVINSKIDGNFPAHPADPTKPENMKQLVDLLTKNNADIGFAFDGDGDRVGIIDEKGRMIWGDQILSILARDILEETPGAPIIADIKSSRLFEQEIERLGGKPVIWKTGHSLVKTKMKELKAPLAGEMSAHIFFADKYFGFDDGLYAAVRFLNILVKSGKKASELVDALPKMFSTPEYRLHCPEEQKFEIPKQIIEDLKAENADFTDIDGVRTNVEAENYSGWWLIRASNTAAEICIRAEASTEQGLEEVKTSLKEKLSKFGIELPS